MKELGELNGTQLTHVLDFRVTKLRCAVCMCCVVPFLCMCLSVCVHACGRVGVGCACVSHCISFSLSADGDY